MKSELYSTHKSDAAPSPFSLYRGLDAAQKAVRHYARPETYTITKADLVLPIYDGNPGHNWEAGCAVNALLTSDASGQWPGEYDTMLSETDDRFGTEPCSRAGVLNELRAAGHQSGVYKSGQNQYLVIFTAN